MIDDDIEPRLLRCALSGHLFDFNQDLGAVEMSRTTAACTPCLNQLFAVKEILRPQGEQPWKYKKPKRLDVERKVSQRA